MVNLDKSSGAGSLKRIRSESSGKVSTFAGIAGSSAQEASRKRCSDACEFTFAILVIPFGAQNLARTCSIPLAIPFEVSWQGVFCLQGT